MDDFDASVKPPESKPPPPVVFEPKPAETSSGKMSPAEDQFKSETNRTASAPQIASDQLTRIGLWRGEMSNQLAVARENNRIARQTVDELRGLRRDMTKEV